jgi:hypothetical protein
VTSRCKLACGVLALCLATAARADNPFEAYRQFSAVVVMSPMPAMPTRGSQGDMKIYRSGDRIRTDLPGGNYLIADLSQHTNYMVMAGMCMQLPAARQQDPFAQAHGATVERSPAGTDTVDGHVCKVENLTVTPQDGQPSKMKVWEAQDLKDFPIKIEVQTSRGPVTVEYKNVSFGDPDASLFVHDNCRQMPAMPGAAPQ